MKNLTKKKQLIAFKHEGFCNAWIHLEKKLFRKTLEKKILFGKDGKLFKYNYQRRFRIYSKNIKKNYFRNKSILLIGCEGFIGFYLKNFFISYFEKLKLNKLF